MYKSLKKEYKKINANTKMASIFNKIVADLGGSAEGQTSETVLTETVSELVAA